MFKDKILLAGAAGLMGAVSDALINFLCFWLKITNETTSHFIAGIIFSSYSLNATQILMGLIGHLIAGAVIGLIPLLIYLWSGKKYPLIKGLAIGAAMWLNHVVLITSLVDRRFHNVPTESGILVELVSLSIWGIVTYGIIAKYGPQITHPLD
ncbi:MAG TPA: hypothetical protein VHY08_21980 [Bacillota bacterium]|nr:hypothetical protein [Bacillota bacterium]